MERKSYKMLVAMSCVSLLLVLSFCGVSYLHTSTPLTVRRIGTGNGGEGISHDGCPTNFGKTHFIVGQTPAQRAAALSRKKVATVNDSQKNGGQKNGGQKERVTVKKDHIDQTSDAVSETLSLAQSAVLFSPDDNVRAYLLDLIAHEQEYIAIAVFVFTDKHIARALIDAHKRGVLVELVTDATGLRDRYSKVRTLCDVEIPVFVYDVQNGKAGLGSVMHHKFVIFKKNKNNKPCVWTGSCNFTRSACESNQENAILLIDNAHVERFLRQFHVLKERSYQYKK